MGLMELIVIFRTQSDIEANIVRGLLETHGIRALLSSDVPHSVWPLTIDGLGEVRLSVRADEADEAQRVIHGYRDDLRGRVVRLRTNFETLEKRLNYTFRDRGLLEQALTHRSCAHEEMSEGSGMTDRAVRIWGFFLRFVCPVVIFVVLLNVFGIV